MAPGYERIERRFQFYIDTFGRRGYTGVAWRTIESIAHWTRRDLPCQGVFTAAPSEDQYVHYKFRPAAASYR